MSNIIDQNEKIIADKISSPEISSSLLNHNIII